MPGPETWVLHAPASVSMIPSSAGAGMQFKVVVLALLGLFSLVIGLVAGALSAMAHIHPALCVSTGAAAFAAAMLLGLAVWNVLK